MRSDWSVGVYVMWLGVGVYGLWSVCNVVGCGSDCNVGRGSGCSNTFSCRVSMEGMQLVAEHPAFQLPVQVQVSSAMERSILTN